jgi:hypothetical protein
MRKIAINLETQKRNASRSLPVTLWWVSLYFDQVLANIKLLVKLLIYFFLALPDPSRAPHVGARNVVRAREVEERAAYIESQMTHQPRVIPGFNPAASSSQSSTQHSAASAQAQSVTTQMAGIAIQVL